MAGKPVEAKLAGTGIPHLNFVSSGENENRTFPIKIGSVPGEFSSSPPMLSPDQTKRGSLPRRWESPAGANAIRPPKKRGKRKGRKINFP